MKKRVYILSTLIAALCITGCSKSSPVLASVQDDRIVLGYVDGDAELDVTTRATAVTSLSSFYAAATTGSAGSESSAFTSTTFTDADSDGKYTGTPVWPSSSVTYNFYGSNLPITFAAAGSTVAATNSTDVVCAYSASATYKTKCDLTFNHVFARLGSVTTAAASGYTISSITMSITPKTGGTYNIRTGAWSSQTTGSATSIANSTVGTKSNDIYLVPGDYTVTLGWTATKGAYSQTFSGQTKSVTLVGGRINSITATLGGNAQDIQFGVSITAWSANSIEFSMPSGGV